MVHGIFLRGPAADLLDRVGVPAVRPVRPTDAGVAPGQGTDPVAGPVAAPGPGADPDADPDADFGAGVRLRNLKDLAYFDGPIRYDGYPALARHIYAREEKGTPFLFFTNVTLSVVKFRLHYLGFK